MRREEIDRLAIYSSERSRGIVHTPEYAARMAELQAEFDAFQALPNRWKGRNSTILMDIG